MLIEFLKRVVVKRCRSIIFHDEFNKLKQKYVSTNVGFYTALQKFNTDPDLNVTFYFV